MTTQQKNKTAKKRWQKVPYSVYLQEKRTRQKTISCVQATSQAEAEFIAQQKWRMHFKILEVKPT